MKINVLNYQSRLVNFLIGRKDCIKDVAVRSAPDLQLDMLLLLISLQI
jgi:hypothetical protein